jgi:predicted phage terminase large subunit-like protein
LSAQPSWWPDQLSEPQRRHLSAVLGSDDVPYCPLRPTPKQWAFLWTNAREAFYGGAAGPGKSTALLMAALQHANVPGYAALLLRRTYPELAQPGGLIPKSHDWLDDHPEVRWNEGRKQWRFPSGASLTFGYLATEEDWRRYQGGEYQFVGFDELTSFTQRQYARLLSRLRRPSEGPLSRVPLRARSASNPGGPGHDWVRLRFVHEATRLPDAVYMPALFRENPHLDVDEYVRSLAEAGLTMAEVARLMEGDWEVADEGVVMQRWWFRVVDEPPPAVASVRAWDLAATEARPGEDPDYTVGLRLDANQDGGFTIRDIQRARLGPGGVEELIRGTAYADGPAVPIRIEQEPGASGKSVVDHYVRTVLRGFSVSAARATGDKVVRARPAAAAAEHGLVRIVAGPWLEDFLREAAAFPEAAHDDQVDAFAAAHYGLTLGFAHPGGVVVSVPQGRVDTRAAATGGRRR